MQGLGSSTLWQPLWCIHCIMPGRRLVLPWGWGSGTIIRSPSSTGCGSCSCSCGPSPASCSSHGTTSAAHCYRKHLKLIIVTKNCKIKVLPALPSVLTLFVNKNMNSFTYFIYCVYRSIYSYIDIPEPMMSCIESGVRYCLLHLLCVCSALGQELNTDTTTWEG